MSRTRVFSIPPSNVTTRLRRMCSQVNDGPSPSKTCRQVESKGQDGDQKNAIKKEKEK